jgi:hypothetical protein
MPLCQEHVINNSLGLSLIHLIGIIITYFSQSVKSFYANFHIPHYVNFNITLSKSLFLNALQIPRNVKINMQGFYISLYISKHQALFQKQT